MKKNLRGKLIAAGLLLTPIIVIVLASQAFLSGWAPDGRTNRGELLRPVAPLKALSLSFDGQLATSAMLDGKWGLLLLGRGGCEQRCRTSMETARNLHLALDRYTPRLIRFYVQLEVLPGSQPTADATGDFRADTNGGQRVAPELLGWLKKAQPGVRLMRGVAATVDALLGQRLSGLSLQSGDALLVDPLGNVVMYYRAAQVGSPLFKDLRHLMKYSKIGRSRPVSDGHRQLALAAASHSDYAIR